MIFLVSWMIASAVADASTIYEYREKQLPFKEWEQKFPAEKQLLGLFQGYSEPVVKYVEHGIQKTRTQDLVVYVSEIKSTIPTPAARLKLEKMIQLENIQKLDPEIKHKLISTSELMPAVAGRGNVENFKWCDPGNGKIYFKLPALEQSLDHLNRPGQPWCSPAKRAVCVESCYIYPKGVRAPIAVHNGVRMVMGKSPKDYGSAMQWEVRYFLSEAEYGSKVPLKQLTGINTPVRGLVEVNIFYFNQIFQYGKILAVFQEHPSNANVTMATTFVAMGIQSKYWHGYGVIREFLKGQSDEFNPPTGLLAGIPVFSQNIVRRLSDLLGE